MFRKATILYQIIAELKALKRNLSKGEVEQGISYIDGIIHLIQECIDTNKEKV